jgi:toxin YoeB
MELEFTHQAAEDLAYWKKINNIAVLKKIRKLLEITLSTRFEGIGKPEALKHNFSGCWSRRIDKEHRLVYEVVENRIIVLSLRGHYN